MFCGNCGSRIAEGSRFCQTCGAPIKSAFVTEENAQKPDFKAPVEQPPVAQPTYNQPPVVQQPMYNQYPQNNGMGYNHPDYTVLGGFLKFLVIMFKYISPIFLILQVVISSSTIVRLFYNNYGSFDRVIFIFEGSSDRAIVRLAISLIISYVIALGGAVLLHILGRKIENKDPNFLRLIQIIYFAATALLVLSVIISIGRVSIFILLGRMIGYLFIQVVGFVLWNLYFVKSQRVRTYMGSDEYMNRCIINMGKLFGVNNNRPMY